MPTGGCAFVGREQEVAALEGRYASPDSELIVLYGRRRVGKTELLTQVSKGKPAVLFTAMAKLPASQLRGFMRAAARSLRAPALAEAPPRDWETAFNLVLGAAPKDRKLLLILDEFQCACESSPELPAVIQQLWDHQWQNTGRLMLVLCGSSVGFMEREVLGGRSPLYGRRTGSLKLEPFSFLAAAKFHPGWSAEKHARAYFVCGGIPACLCRFKIDVSVEQNIVSGILGRDGCFQGAPLLFLRQELSEFKQAIGILEAIALGLTSQGEIARAVGLSPDAVAPHLEDFVQLGILERVRPLSPKEAPHSSAVYRVADAMLRFWFRFVEPNIDALADLTPEQAFEQLVAPQWESFCDDGFERLCREALPLLYRREGIFGRKQVGEYWARDTQIDVVGLRSDGWVDLAECRWAADASAGEAIGDITARAQRYPAGGLTVARRLFLRSAPRTLRKDVRVHDLRELYALGAAPPGQERATT